MADEENTSDGLKTGAEESKNLGFRFFREQAEKKRKRKETIET